MTIVTFRMTTIWVMKDTLYSDRKAGSSQLFEISPFSNLKFASPPTFKKLIDDWDNIKPHKYYDSDEASI